MFKVTLLTLPKSLSWFVFGFVFKRTFSYVVFIPVGYWRKSSYRLVRSTHPSVSGHCTSLSCRLICPPRQHLPLTIGHRWLASVQEIPRDSVMGHHRLFLSGLKYSKTFIWAIQKKTTPFFPTWYIFTLNILLLYALCEIKHIYSFLYYLYCTIFGTGICTFLQIFFSGTKFAGQIKTCLFWPFFAKKKNDNKTDTVALR